MTDKATITTYDNSTKELAAYFAVIGSRSDIIVEDELGKRWFYYYDEATITKALGKKLEIVKIKRHVLKRKTAKWLVVMAKKV